MVNICDGPPSKLVFKSLVSTTVYALQRQPVGETEQARLNSNIHFESQKLLVSKKRAALPSTESYYTLSL